MHPGLSKTNMCTYHAYSWTADHDFDSGPGQTQIDVYVARGILVESQSGPIWMYATASEHHVLYNYQFVKANNIYCSMLQSETPYFQSEPAAPAPFANSVDIFESDPDMRHCTRFPTTCAMGWAMRILYSQNIMIYGAGFYSWFQKYNQADCIEQETCQDRLVETQYSEKIWIYNIVTKGVQEVITPGGGRVVRQAPNQNGYLATISVWLPLALTGATIGGPIGTSSISNGTGLNQSPARAPVVPIPGCTTLAAGATLTITSACATAIADLDNTGINNVPSGPLQCTVS